MRNEKEVNLHLLRIWKQLWRNADTGTLHRILMYSTVTQGLRQNNNETQKYGNPRRICVKNDKLVSSTVQIGMYWKYSKICSQLPQWLYLRILIYDYENWEYIRLTRIWMSKYFLSSFVQAKNYITNNFSTEYDRKTLRYQQFF